MDRVPKLLSVAFQVRPDGSVTMQSVWRFNTRVVRHIDRYASVPEACTAVVLQAARRNDELLVVKT